MRMTEQCLPQLRQKIRSRTPVIKCIGMLMGYFEQFWCLFDGEQRIWDSTSEKSQDGWWPESELGFLENIIKDGAAAL